MNRGEWTRYRNLQMYDHVIEDIYEVRVAKNLDYPVWINRDGKECHPREVSCYKINHHIKYPDLSIVGDKVGEN